MARILLIEDDMDLQEGLQFALDAEGLEVGAAGTKAEGERMFFEEQYDLIVMDCNLPDGSGFEMCRDLRKKSGVPILMLTARDTEMDEVLALESGVDDYMRKPFSLAVLKLRINNLLRKYQPKDQLKVNGLVIDKGSCKVYRNDEEISVSAVEYKMLLFFMENQGQVLTKEQILERIWDHSGKFVDANTVSVNIRRLRMKIEEDSANPKYIRTVHGLGYIFSE